MLTALAISADTVFDTTLPAYWDGTQKMGNFGALDTDGSPFTPTYGQTFIAPADNILTSFSFRLYPEVAGVSLQLRAFVYEWNGGLLAGGGGGARGSNLIPAANQVQTYTGTPGSFQVVNVATGGITLTAGGEYVLGLTVSDATDFAASTGWVLFGVVPMPTAHVPASAGGGGGFVYYNNGNDISLLTSTADPWDGNSDMGDLAFTANFTRDEDDVPEPASFALLGLGLAAFGFARRRRA